MAAPVAGVAIRIIALRYGIAVVRLVAKHVTKRAVTSKIRRKPKPPGQTKSRGGEHTASGGTPGARKTMRGPSAQKRAKQSGRSRSTYFRRDEDRYR